MINQIKMHDDVDECSYAIIRFDVCNRKFNVTDFQCKHRGKINTEFKCIVLKKLRT